MRELVLVVPAPVSARTGGSIYDRRIAEGLRARGWIVDVKPLDGAFPLPGRDAVMRAAAVLADLPDRATVLVDGLVFGALPDQIESQASRLRFVALVHLPLAHAPGLSAGDAARFAQQERRALSHAAGAIVTGRSVVEVIAACGLGRDRIAVVEPGVDRVPVARGSGGPDVALLSVGTANRGKAHDLLVRALAAVPLEGWRLVCAGSLVRDPAAVARLREAIEQTGLAERVTLLGELDDEQLAQRYDAADAFVLATLHETFGMAVAEALARGLPVVSTKTGAIPQLVGDRAGLLVEPGDVEALTRALTVVIADERRRQELAAGARAVRESLPDWASASDRMASALKRLITA